MSVGPFDEELDPHEYYGLVYDCPAEQIPVRLARVAARDGDLIVWQHQAFAHHMHFPFDEDCSPTEEMKVVREYESILSERFPDKRFVIAVSPCDQITWYQPFTDAPTEDEEEWEVRRLPGSIINGPGDGNTGTCEKCGKATTFTEPQDHPKHRGIRTITCAQCGASHVGATRVIRFKVGF
ncbi:MAG TPA: hypothetical protein VNI20_08685 [Fimbriimonadaceae bacterium]|nr:hypothetical protein [Fimbriimonadaceae bacterium]